MYTDGKPLLAKEMLEHVFIQIYFNELGQLEKMEAFTMEKSKQSGRQLSRKKRCKYQKQSSCQILKHPYNPL
jgi:hypothetical protein